MRAFLSHNAADKPTGRILGSQMVLAGAEVWFDEWELRPGDSLPGAINNALASFDTFILLWSQHASSSKWVRAELESALAQRLADESTRIIPVLLDETPLPPLLQAIFHIRVGEDDITAAVDGIMGFTGPSQRIRAIQEALDEAHIEVRYFYGYGPMVGCPDCGANADALAQWGATDYQRDDQYAGARCTKCGWEGGGEV